MCSTRHDRAGQPKVVVINEAAAREFWGAEDPVGKRIGVGQGGFGDGAEVIGVVADVRYGEVETSVKPDVYLPLLQSMRVSGYLFVRGRVSNEALVPAIRAEVQAMDADLPVTDARDDGGAVWGCDVAHADERVAARRVRGAGPAACRRSVSTG